MNGCIYRTEENKCKQFSVGGVLSFCYLDGTCDCQIPSNADRIRSMTDEELAELFKNLCCPYSLGGKVDCNIENRGCGNCWMSWLKSPVEEVDNG